VHLAHPEILVHLDLLVFLVQPDLRGQQEHKELRVHKVQLAQRVPLVQLDQPELPVHLGLLEQQDQQELQDFLALQEVPEPAEQQDFPDRQDLPEGRDPLVRLALQETRDHWGHREPPVLAAPLGLPVLLVLPARQDLRALLVTPVLLAQLARQAAMVLRAPLVLLVLREQQESQEQPVQREHQVSPGRQVLLVSKDLLGPLGQREVQERVGNRAVQEVQGPRDLREHLELLVLLVQAEVLVSPALQVFLVQLDQLVLADSRALLGA